MTRQSATFGTSKKERAYARYIWSICSARRAYISSSRRRLGRWIGNVNWWLQGVAVRLIRPIWAVLPSTSTSTDGTDQTFLLLSGPSSGRSVSGLVLGGADVGKTPTTRATSSSVDSYPLG